MEEFEFQYYTPTQFHHNIIQNTTQNGSQSQSTTQAQFVQFQQQQQQQQKQNDSRCNTNTSKGAQNMTPQNTQSMVYSMDRLSPYGNYQDDSRSNNLSNLTLDQIFKTNQTDDQSNLVVVNSNESILLYQQQQQQQQQQTQTQNNQQQQTQTATSASPSTTSMSSSSSPQSSSSPSSTNDTNSNYVESLQLLDCGMGQQQGQIQHHQGPQLVSLVPPTSSTLNPLLNPMMNLISPSKPTNISELSNSSMVSSTSSSSTLDSNQFRTSIQTSSRTRTRNSNPKQQGVEYQKDGKYFERRKRNNVAAKKSRDARKQREDEIAIRASFLEKENSILKAQLQTLKDEAQQLRILLTQKKASQSMGGLMAPSCTNCSNCMSKQMSNTYVPTMSTITTGYETEPTINLVDQKLTTSTSQTNAANNNAMYLAQPHQNQQLNRLI